MVPPRFPWWWFTVITLPMVPYELFSATLWAFVWPAVVAKFAGYSSKAVVLAASGQVAEVLHWCGPLIGAASDRLPERFSRRWGRRRPFIVLGNLLCALGTWIIYHSTNRAAANEGPPMWEELLVGLILSNVGGMLFDAPFFGMIPEVVPLVN